MPIKPTLETLLSYSFGRFLAGRRKAREGSKLLLVHGATPLPAVVRPAPTVPRTLEMLESPVTKPAAHDKNQQAARQDASHYADPPLSLQPAGCASETTINHGGVACHVCRESTSTLALLRWVDVKLWRRGGNRLRCSKPLPILNRGVRHLLGALRGKSHKTTRRT